MDYELFSLDELKNELKTEEKRLMQFKKEELNVIACALRLFRDNTDNEELLEKTETLLEKIQYDYLDKLNTLKYLRNHHG